ncbi:MAG: hypothetical protein EOM54_05615 [Clostridia bacterium]|nr:hypothetical protein [Clostridia bacterium]
MLSRSAAFDAAIIADTRKILARSVIDLIDPDITYSDATSSGASTYSKGAHLHDKVFDRGARYADLGWHRWILGGSIEIYPDDPADVTDEQGFKGSVLSDIDCVFSTAQWVQLNISNCSVLQACSVWFTGSGFDGWPVDFTVAIYAGETILWSESVSNNTSKTGAAFDGFTVYNPTAVRLTVTKWSHPRRELRCIEIVPGIYETWDTDDIMSLEFTDECDPSCLRLPYGVGKLAIKNIDRRFEPTNKNGLFESLEDRQGQTLELGPRLPSESVEYLPAGFLYLQNNGWTTGNNDMTISWTVTTILGLLANRTYLVPATLPTTFDGWLASIVAQLGENFEGRYVVDTTLGTTVLTCDAEDIDNIKCSELLLNSCMGAGAAVGYPVFPRMDPETGYLKAATLSDDVCQIIDLDNLESYPTKAANDDLAALIFDISGTKYTVAGTCTGSENTKRINNPFITSTTLADAAARNILRFYGGNRFVISGRGNPAGELGDSDSIYLDNRQAIIARRVKQQYRLMEGVMSGVSSEFIRGSSAYDYSVRVVIDADGMFTVPGGVTQLYIIVVGGGQGGTDGADGTDDDDGTPGSKGAGGKVYAGTISVTPGSEISVSVGLGGSVGVAGSATTFGAYSSASGAVFENGLADIQSGGLYGYPGEDGEVSSTPLNGVAAPAGTGAGGSGGSGGSAAVWAKSKVDGFSFDYIAQAASTGGSGSTGASGCVIIYYNV